MADLQVKAGDTEPIGYQLEVTTDSDVSLADIDEVRLYARAVGASSNHIDGASLTIDSVSTSQNDDGTWAVTINVTFDPTGNGPSGADAFSTGDAGTYEVYSRVVWSDGDETRHPNDDNRVWEIGENFES